MYTFNIQFNVQMYAYEYIYFYYNLYTYAPEVYCHDVIDYVFLI